MRVSLALFLLAAASSTASAGDTAKLRPATENEIRQNLPGATDLKDSSNGYQYRSGSSTGYKISDGKICVAKPGQSADCLDVLFDGKHLESIDRRGNRDVLN